MSVPISNRPKSQMNILDKRIPRNPKYANVQSTIDTGDSLTKFLKRNEDLRASKKQQTGEIFKRMKVSTLIQLIIQVADINSFENLKNGEDDPSASQRTLTADTDRPQTQDSVRSIASSRSTLQSVIRGVGEMDAYNNYRNSYTNTPQTPTSEQIDLAYKECPYLIVDLRDKDEFNTNHIVSAHHYPAPMLSRCTNNESKELLIYKNQKGKIIILYDEDERMAPRAATIMIERGYNNLFLLSGGLKYAVKKFPRGLITGRCPLSWTSSRVPATPTGKPKRTQSMNLLPSEIPIGQSIAQVTRPVPGPMITFDAREQFTKHDIEQLNTQLEDNLLPRDTASRLSRSHTHLSHQSSRMSIASERSNLSNVSDKPWKP
ncbi:unnamed protein product [Rotaria magnacalcarata]|uniref:Rhodanese domain-containing protein n=6 Tax=Rotaria magnacalcarata TaxID=392030 RepID=A0A819AM39_9BILA|nr:unnamed protein product [Rotaria magnacalcarata]CAF2259908.1 unnamed protein product [Rotaria magnacalcarata]CAF3783109.1 unnamed protein product [Rotaria magnacalcarata]CAF3787510.1 unnamed protein product [Rotaria magnacalcarata]CAF3846949.1 unnamed protein product [Rotaria magnacalcarata]